MPALVRIKDQPVKFQIIPKNLLKHICDHLQGWTVGYRLGYDLTVEHVKNRRKAYLPVFDFDLCHACCPFPFRCFSREVPAQYILGNLSYFSFIGAVSPPSLCFSGWIRNILYPIAAMKTDIRGDRILKNV